MLHYAESMEFLDWESLGGNLTRIRKLRRWTQKELADRLSVHTSMVTRWEKGQIRPKEAQVQQIAEALEVSTADLLAPLPAGSASESPVPAVEPELAELLRQVSFLDKSDRQAVKAVIEAMVVKNRIRDVVGSSRLLQSTAS